MYKIFYATLLITAILLGIITLATGIIGRRPTKIWGYIMGGLAGICVVALIGFIVTTSIL